MVATPFEAVAFDGVRYLDAGIYPLVGYALEGFIVTPYLQRRTEGETVYVMTEGALKSYNGSLAIGVNPITADFKIGGVILHTLAHFHYHQEHSDYLITLHSGDYVEIGLVSDYSLFGLLDFNSSATFGA